MPASKKKAQRPALRALAAAALATMAATAVAQESNPYYIGVSQAFSRDSNVFRMPSSGPLSVFKVSDTISTTSLLGGVDLQFGRQRLRSDLSATHTKFDELSRLDNTGYRASVDLDWQTIERLSGTVELLARKSLASYGLESALGLTERNIQETRSGTLSARWGLVSLLALEGRYNHRRIEFSAVPTSSFEQDAVSFGVIYRPSGLLTLGVLARVTEGEYLNVADEYDRRDLDFTATWTPTGASQVTGRISATKTDHSLDTQRDISGVTGAVEWNWKPTGRLRFISGLTRDTGNETAFGTGPDGGQVAVGDNSRIVTTASVRTLYDVTAKIQADGTLRLQRRSTSNVGDADIQQYSIGLRYVPTRTLSLGCSLGHEKRDASFSYKANTASCFGQFVLQP